MITPKRLRKKDSKGPKLVKRQRLRKPPTLADELIAIFKGRKPVNTSVRFYEKRNTHHETYSVAPDRLKSMLDKYGGRNFNMILTYTDKDGKTQHRSTGHTGSGDPDLLLELFLAMINKYQTSAEIESVDEVSIDVWGNVDTWGDEILGGQFADDGEDEE